MVQIPLTNEHLLYIIVLSATYGHCHPFMVYLAIITIDNELNHEKYDDSSGVCALNKGAFRRIIERVLLGQGDVCAYTGYYYSSLKSET